MKLNNQSPCSLCPQSVLQSPLTTPQAGATNREFEQVLLKIIWFLQENRYWRRGPCCTGDNACPPPLLSFCSHLSTEVAFTLKVNICHQLQTLLINLHTVYLKYFLPCHMQNLKENKHIVLRQWNGIYKTRKLHLHISVNGKLHTQPVQKELFMKVD